MFCSQCGKENPDSSLFCIKCGHSLPGIQAAPPSEPHKKKRSGLFIGLIAGGLVLITVLLVLFLGVIPMLNKESGDRGIETTETVAESAIVGLWSSKNEGIVLKFKTNDTVTIYTSQDNIKGTFEYDKTKGNGVIVVATGDYNFSVAQDELVLNEVGTENTGIFTKVDDQNFDIQEFIDNNSKTLVMGTNAQFPPFEYLEGGAVVGVDADLMAAIAKEMGVKLKISDMEFDSLPTALVNKQIDVIAAGFTVTPDREETMDFSTPYYVAEQTIIVLKDSIITSKENLKDKVIGVQSGTTGQFDAENWTSDTNIKGFESGMLAVEALKNGQVDAVIIDDNAAQVYGDETPDTLVLIRGQFDAEEYAIAVPKGNDVLLKKINAALDKLKADGTFDDINSKYMK